MSHVTVVKFKLPVTAAAGVAKGSSAVSTSPPDRSKREEPAGSRSPVNSGMRGSGKAMEQQQRQQQRIKQLEVIISQVSRGILLSAYFL